jgi:hypothetical protein
METTIRQWHNGFIVFAFTNKTKRGTSYQTTVGECSDWEGLPAAACYATIGSLEEACKASHMAPPTLAIRIEPMPHERVAGASFLDLTNACSNAHDCACRNANARSNFCLRLSWKAGISPSVLFR